MINKQNIILDDELVNVDNNPFSYKGRINRLVYFFTSVVLGIFRLLIDFVKYLFDKNQNDYILYAFILSMMILGVIEIFTIIKRLRDIKWSPWLCLLGFIPYIVIIFRILLLFIKGKYGDTDNSKSTK